MKLVHATPLACVVSLQACGGGSGGGSDDSASGFHPPSYGNARSGPRWQADLTSVTDWVVAYQDVGSELAPLTVRFRKTLESMP